MILSAPNQAPFTVPGSDLKVQASLALPDRDMGGFGSWTDTSSGGSDPKKLSVSLVLPFTAGQALQALLAIAEAQDSDGERIIYDIVDRTARAFGVRQVTFSGSVSAKEKDQLHAWDVSFTLIEKRSTAELLEARREPEAVSGIDTDGAPLEGQGETEFTALIVKTGGKV